MNEPSCRRVIHAPQPQPPPSPEVLFGFGAGGSGGKFSAAVLGLTLASNANGGVDCVWSEAAALSEPRSSGCTTQIPDGRVLFAGGHNNSADYVGTVDVFAAVGGGKTTLVETLQLPVGRELLGWVAPRPTTPALLFPPPPSRPRRPPHRHRCRPAARHLAPLRGSVCVATPAARFRLRPQRPLSRPRGTPVPSVWPGR